jgi:predicted short-subunit dehydrogenase-like oxidoreductase (DUF2520 family)
VKTLNIIGCGKVGGALAKVWTERDVFRVRSVLNQSLSSAQRAVAFLGEGRAVESYDRLGPADAFMISTLDEAIEGCCEKLCRAGVLREGAIVFHCSGSLPSELLAPARAQGAHVASLHPVKSFTDSAKAAETFPGTFCDLEGAPDACQVLRDALERSGAHPFDVDPDAKMVYHAATVFVCNYLVALLEIGLRCFEQSGVSRPRAMEIMEPIVQGTIRNVFALGPAQALTGPIARGEASVVGRQCEALGQWDETVQNAYRVLGQVAADLSEAKGDADGAALARIRELLGE